MGRVLIISTSASALQDKPTGLWLEELATPYYVFKNAGHEVTVSSIAGGEIPLDAASLSGDFLTEECKTFQADETAMKALRESVPLASVNPADYDIIFVPGGHGTCTDFPTSADLKTGLSKAAAAGRVVGCVCHGPVALVGVTGPDGSPLVAGKEVTGFTNTEEEAVGLTSKVPFLLEDKLKELGGKYSRGGDWTSYAVRDGKLVTGQNPQSSRAVAEKCLEAL